jgi:hypothetical protein
MKTKTAHEIVRRRSFVLAACLLLVAFSLVEAASASNMAFKFNARVWSQGTGAKGRNLFSFPDNNPYNGPGGLTALCTALNLGPSGQITQWTGSGGIFVYTCGQVQTFNMLEGKGAMITHGTDATGILVGSDNPAAEYTIHDLGASPVGTNVATVKYHSTCTTPECLCVDCGLSATATITRFDAQGGQVFAHTCGQVPLWTLQLGEAVLILEDNGPRTCRPSHF